jgi:hypothetical protein
VEPVYAFKNSEIRNKPITFGKDPTRVPILQHDGDWLSGISSSIRYKTTIMKFYYMEKGMRFPMIFFYFCGLKFYSDEKVACYALLLNCIMR